MTDKPRTPLGGFNDADACEDKAFEHGISHREEGGWGPRTSRATDPASGGLAGRVRCPPAPADTPAHHTADVTTPTFGATPGVNGASYGVDEKEIPVGFSVASSTRPQGQDDDHRWDDGWCVDSDNASVDHLDSEPSGTFGKDEDEDEDEDQTTIDPELTRILQNLSSTIDTAHQILYAAATTHARSAKSIEAIAPPPPSSNEPASRQRRRVGAGIIAAAAAGLALVGWFAWHMHDTAPLSPDSVSGDGSEANVDARPVAASTAAEPAADRGARDAPGRAHETPPTPLVRRIHGLAGQPIPLGIAVPQQAEDTDVSVMIQGVPEAVSLSVGRRVGADTWILAEEEVTGAILIVPGHADLSAFSFDVTFVTSDGRIQQTQEIAAVVEPAAVLEPIAAQAAPEGDVPAPATSIISEAPSSGQDLGSAVTRLDPAPRQDVVLQTEAADAQPEVQAEEATATASLPPITPDAETVLLEKVEASLSPGDIAAARLIFEYAARRSIDPAPRQDVTASPEAADAQPEVQAEEATAEAQVEPLTPETEALLLEKGEELLRQGDVAAARVIFRHAARRGSQKGQTALTVTYDAEHLKRLGVRGLKAD